MNTSIQPKQGQSIRARGGSLRICYDPAWSPSRPYCTFENGTAKRSFGSLFSAIYSLTRTSARWTEWA